MFSDLFERSCGLSRIHVSLTFPNQQIAFPRRMEDLAGPCNEMSVPPLCAMTTFTDLSSSPPQLGLQEQFSPPDVKCPNYDASLDLADGPGLAAMVKRAYS